MNSRPHLRSLDVLRLIAIVLVLGRHLALPAPLPPGAWNRTLLAWQRGGWQGVDLFFVLSGFLVSGLLFTEYKARGRFSTGRFYMRRAWRIYPPLLVLIATTIVVHLSSGRRLDPAGLASELLFFQSYVPGVWIHTWSLSVEEHFYLLLPLALTGLLRLQPFPMPRTRAIALAAGVAVSELSLRLLTWYHPVTQLFASHLRMDALFCGVAISYTYHFYPGRFVTILTPWRRWLIAGGALLLAPGFVYPLDTALRYGAGLSVCYAGSGMLLAGAILCDLPPGRATSLLAALGACSYSIYLWHIPVAGWGIRLAELAWGPTPGFGARSALYLAGSLGAGVVMARAVEFPALRLRNLWFPAQRFRLAWSAAAPVSETEQS